jgi:hypothetical protein
MRRILRDQLVLVPAFHGHVHAREQRAMSRILDEHPEAARGVHLPHAEVSRRDLLKETSLTISCSTRQGSVA